MKKNGNPFIHIIIGGNRIGIFKNIPAEKGVVVFKSNPDFYKTHSVSFPVMPINLLWDVMAFPDKKLPAFPYIIVSSPPCMNYSGERKPNTETK